MTKDEALKLALETLEADPLEMVADANGHMVFLKDKAITAIKEALAQPENEPLAWISTGPATMIHWTADKPAYGDDWVPLYTAPPQRTWVGLTEEEIDKTLRVYEQDYGWISFAKAIEAKLKLKNTRGQE